MRVSTTDSKKNINFIDIEPNKEGNIIDTSAWIFLTIPRYLKTCLEREHIFTIKNYAPGDSHPTGWRQISAP